MSPVYMYIVTSSSCRRPNLPTRHPDPVNCHLPDICGLAEHRVDSPVAATVSLCGQTHSRIHLCHVLGPAGVFTCIQYTCTCMCVHVGPAGVFTCIQYTCMCVHIHVWAVAVCSRVYNIHVHVGRGGVCVCVHVYTLYMYVCEMRRKEERSKQGQTNNKAKQHSTP